jgi:two-component system sensor histidine kinase ChiS
VGRMEKGDYDTRVTIRSRDEIGDLGQGFNTMGQHLRGYISEITQMSNAYSRFVPKEFLQLLEKEKITEVELKQNKEICLTILFADIREFTSLSLTMGSDDNFKFLNSYLSRMGPIIRAHHGFIDKYLGDGIMALFPGNPSDGVAAAMDMQREMYKYNKDRARCSYPAISIGIGVHAEKVILGIVGEQERMQGTVIGNAVNLASRLEGLTKVYGARIIVSDDVIEAMGKDAPDHRYLGDATVKGMENTVVPIHEIFGADPPGDVRLKRHTRVFFEAGVGMYRQGAKFQRKDLASEALRYFRAVLKAVSEAHAEDRPAAYYVKECSGKATPSPAPGTLDEA